MATELFQPSPEELRDMLLSDMRLAAADAGQSEPPTQPGSDWYMLATGIGNIGLLAFTNINSAEAASDALEATGDDLDEIRDADGLPEIGAAGSSGKLVVTILGATTITNGTPFTLPNGLGGTVIGTFVNPADQSEVDVAMTDVGAATNLAGGSTVKFAPAPVNVATEAKVSTSFPLVGGTDAENDGRKRDRILSNRRNKPAGGNWSQLREWALEALPSAQDCYVYPALAGASSAKVIVVRELNLALMDYSRALNAVQLQAVRSFIQTKMPGQNDLAINTSLDDALDTALLVKLPDSSLIGGNGLGWIDGAPWPALVPADLGAVTVVSADSTNSVITVSANTTTAPIAGLTHVAWWSSLDRKFQSRLVTAQSGGVGAWVLTLESPLIDTTGTGPQPLDYFCPAASNLDAYGAAWVSLIGGFGPGEQTTDPNRLPRAKRHPFVTDEDPTDITNTTIAQWRNGFPEVTGFSLSFANKTTPSIPALVSPSSSVLIPRRFAIYKL